MEERNIQGVKTIFVPAEVEGINIEKSLKKIKIKEKKIGFITTVFPRLTNFGKMCFTIELNLQKK